MVVVGGAVAYLGDHIGRSIGKKRLRVGRLRPKHTAMIGTFVAGMLGTLATVVVLALISEPVRVWILEGEQARKEADELKKEVSQLQKHVQDKETELNQKTNDVNAKDFLIQKRDQTLAERNAEVADLQKRSVSLVNQVKDQTNRASLALAQYKKTQTDLTNLRKLQGELEKQIADSRSGLADTQKENVQLQVKNFELQQASDNLTEEITANEKTIEDLNALIASINAAKDAIEKDFDVKLQQNQIDLQNAERNLEQTKDELEAINRELRAAKIGAALIVQRANEELGAQRLQPLIFNRNDELTRIAVNAQTPRAEVEALLNKLLSDAGEQARLRGATRGFDASFVFVLAVQNSLGLDRTVNEQIQTAIADITNHSQNHLLIARSPVNSFKQESAAIAIEVVRNPLVYSAGDVVLTLQIDGRIEEDQIIDQIFSFLQANLFNQAVKDGMIPAIGQEAPIGEVTRDQILEMADRVKAANREIRLQLLARTDTRAGDKLKLDFRLRP